MHRIILLCALLFTATGQSQIAPLPKHIIGGEDAGLGEFPFVAKIIYSGSQVGCTGSLIAPDKVLTVVLRMGERAVFKDILRQGKIAGFVDEYFPGLSGSTNALIVQTDPSGGQITVLALELINSNLVTLPAALIGSGF